MKPPPVSPKVTQAGKVKPRLETVFLWGRRAVSGRRASFLIQLPTPWWERRVQTYILGWSLHPFPQPHLPILRSPLPSV